MDSNEKCKTVTHNLTFAPFSYGSGEIPRTTVLNEYYASNDILIYNNDCLDVIGKLEDNSIDLVVTSPPFNVNLGNNKYNKNPYDLYQDNKEHRDFIGWLESVFSAIYPKLKSSGRIAINIGDRKNGRIATHSDIIHFMTHKIGYLMFGQIIWEKGHIGNRTSWGSWCSPSCPSFPTPYEYILIFAKDSLTLSSSGETDLQKQEFIDWSLAIWNIQPETNMKRIGHPAMYPVDLPIRLTKMLSWKNSVVLDPFNGAGSTALACLATNRKYIGIEISKIYCDITRNRINRLLAA